MLVLDAAQAGCDLTCSIRTACRGLDGCIYKTLFKLLNLLSVSHALAKLIDIVAFQFLGICNGTWNIALVDRAPI